MPARSGDETGSWWMLLVKTRLYWVSVALTPKVGEVKVIGKECDPNSNGWSLCKRRGSNRRKSRDGR